MENHNIEDSQDAKRPPITVVNGEAKPGNGKKKKVFLSLASVILIAGLGTGGYLYSQEKTNSSELNSQVEVLNSEIDSLQQQEQTGTEEEAQTQSEVSDSEGQTAEQTEYTAKVGKFTLALPSKYYVIEELDGGFEGGPATQIKVATAKDSGVISDPVTANLSISAVPSKSSQQEFDEYVKNRLKEYPSYKQADSIKIDDQEAQVYEIDNLLGQKSIFFQSKDKKIYYEITVVDGSKQFSGTKALLDDTVEGFKFN